MNYQASTNNSSLMLHIRSEDSVSATPSHFKASIDPQSIDLKEQMACPSLVSTNSIYILSVK